MVPFKIKRKSAPKTASMLFTGFEMNQRGGLMVHRKQLHQSPGYLRQIQALEALKRIRSRNPF